LTTTRYRCDDPVRARVFLKQKENIINGRDNVIVVETPRGMLIRTFDGIVDESDPEGALRGGSGPEEI